MKGRSRDIQGIRIATRGSALALAQARMVLELCRTAFPRRRFELEIIKTTGDRRQSASMNRPAPDLPKGLFTKELEVALLAGQADLAVHSLKDLPTSLPAGLRLGAVLPRADVRDVLVTRSATTPANPPRPGAALPMLRPGAVVATSSTRRVAQLRALRPDLRFVEIRGNVPTRLRKLAEDARLEATVLAAAGLARLGIGPDAEGRLLPPPELRDPGWGRDLHAYSIAADLVLPAPGQAAIGIECRSGDARILRLCRHLNHAGSRACVEAERAFLAGFGGGCHSPVGALATVRAGRLELVAVAFDGDRRWQGRAKGATNRPRSLGTRLGRAARKALFD